MRSLTLLLLALAAALAWGQGETKKADPPAVKGLVVHEWGIWRVHNDVDLANADMRAIWDDLPKFVYGQISGRTLPKHWQNNEPVDRPVLFFHTPTALDLGLRIDFPTGLPAVWWPGTQTPGIQDGLVPDGPFHHLVWDLRLKEAPPRRGAAPQYERVDPKHWVETLRKVKADDVFARVGERRFGCERERFVYYDGLLPRGDWVSLAFDKDRVSLTSKAKHPVFDVTLVDRRKDKVRVARLPKLAAEAKTVVMDLKEVDRVAFFKDGPLTLLRQLKEAGLYEDEANALVELSRTELFETEGLTLFYRLPQDEYDRQLPLTMKPAPEKLVRVGLVIHPHCEPDLAKRVEDLVKDLNADDYQTRERAQKRLETLGRAAFAHLVRLRKANLSAEARGRLERVLAQIETTLKK